MNTGIKYTTLTLLWNLDLISAAYLIDGLSGNNPYPTVESQPSGNNFVHFL